MLTLQFTREMIKVQHIRSNQVKQTVHKQLSFAGATIPLSTWISTGKGKPLISIVEQTPRIRLTDGH